MVAFGQSNSRWDLYEQTGRCKGVVEDHLKEHSHCHPVRIRSSCFEQLNVNAHLEHLCRSKKILNSLQTFFQHAIQKGSGTWD